MGMFGYFDITKPQNLNGVQRLKIMA